MADEERTRLGRPESYVLPPPAPSNAYKHSRVTSTVAQSFAADLDSMFGLGMGTGGGLDSLSQTVEEKKQNVSSGQSELELLEAKLRETEQRLAKASRHNSPSRQADTGAAKDNVPLGGGGQTTEKQAHPFAQRPTYPEDRPPTGKRPQTGRETTQEMMSNMPGAMPEEPEQTNGRDDYVMVDNGRGR